MDTRKSRAVIRIVDDDKGVRDSYKYLIEGECRRLFRTR